MATKRPVVTDAAEAESIARFRESELEAHDSDFELERAKKAFIPLLRASYAFAEGNANPDLPKGYKIVAPIRRSDEEAMPVLRGKAGAAIAHDFAAMGLGGEESAESVADPNAFGFVIRENSTGALIVSLRGTKTPNEWLKNFTMVPNPFSQVPGFGLVHLGFESLWNSVRGDVMNALEDEPAATRITFLGHSLGGAMATLGTVDITKNMKRPAVDLCTFGGPRVGKIRFRINFNKLIKRCYRVVELRDIVPRVPSVLTAWNHVGEEIEVRSQIDNAHSLESYLQGMENLNREATALDHREALVGKRVIAVRTR